MGKRIMFTKTNVGIADGLEARATMENLLAEHFMHIGGIYRNALKVSGFTLTKVTGALSVDIGAGIGIINGRRVETNSTYRLTGLAPSVSTNYIFAYYAVDGSGCVTGTLEFLVQSSATAPANALLIGRCTANGTEVTTTYETVPWRIPMVGSYVGNGSGSREIFLGFRPKVVIVYGSAGIPPGVIAFKVDVDSYGISIPYTSSLNYPFLDTDEDRVTTITDVGFTVGYVSSPNPDYTLNRNTITYRYAVFA